MVSLELLVKALRNDLTKACLELVSMPSIRSAAVILTLLPVVSVRYVDILCAACSGFARIF